MKFDYAGNDLGYVKLEKRFAFCMRHTTGDNLYPSLFIKVQYKVHQPSLGQKYKMLSLSFITIGSLY